jgi:uncharacterized membrane protein
MPNGKMGTGRLEAFSDGVIAIIVTVMVLQLTPPAQPTFSALLKEARSSSAMPSVSWWSPSCG